MASPMFNAVLKGMVERGKELNIVNMGYDNVSPYTVRVFEHRKAGIRFRLMELTLNPVYITITFEPMCYVGKLCEVEIEAKSALQCILKEFRYHTVRTLVRILCNKIECKTADEIFTQLVEMAK